MGVGTTILFSFFILSHSSVLGNYIENKAGLFIQIPYLLAMFTGLGDNNIMTTGELNVLAKISTLSITFLLYFIVGAILGWLYGKLKNRKISSI